MYGTTSSCRLPWLPPGARTYAPPRAVTRSTVVRCVCFAPSVTVPPLRPAVSGGAGIAVIPSDLPETRTCPARPPLGREGLDQWSGERSAASAKDRPSPCVGRGHAVAEPFGPVTDKPEQGGVEALRIHRAERAGQCVTARNAVTGFMNRGGKSSLHRPNGTMSGHFSPPQRMTAGPTMDVS